ncbi:MAG: hypothetical protein ACYTG3_03860 [Planctomycetota bacterium]
MRMRERGIGNLAFIAVIVLFVLALGMWFMAKDEADNFKIKLDQERVTSSAQRDKLVGARNAYDAMVEVLGYTWPELQRKEDSYPEPSQLKNKIRTELTKITEDIKQRSRANTRARVYQFPTGTNGIEVTKGDMTTVTLYATPHVKETATVAAILEPLGGQFEYAAKVIEANNSQFETENETYKKRVGELSGKIAQVQSKYEADVSSKGQQFDTQKTRADDMQDQVNTLSAANDALQTDKARIEEEAGKKQRVLERDLAAWIQRALNEKAKKEVALKEDPKDGEVLYAAPRRSLVFINRGRRHKVANGTRFTVWRAGKGNVREDIAIIRVIEVDRTKSTARVLKRLNPRVPVAQGMNISNPFYDPHRKLKVYIYGDLKQYPTDVAKRRLAESNVTVARRLDDTVNVIVLGEPPVTVAEDIEDEAEAAMAEKQARVERDRRLKEVIEKARVIGAIVVTEGVLRTFIEY